MNFYSCIGRVGRDAIVRHAAAGDAVAGFSVAVDSGFGDKKQTLWFDCSLWGKRAESVGPLIRKGDRIGLVGEVGTRVHEGKTYLTLRVSELTLLGVKSAAETQQAA